jgi:hypothetical protein
MSDRPLPDDPARWPANPSELLGVPFGGPLRDLRRAYTRLIRIYKPEQYPEQFRLIRAAYDFLRHFARSSDEPDPATPADGDTPRVFQEIVAADHLATQAGDEDAGARQQDRSPPAPGLEDELDDLWAAAVDGDPAKAYQRLVQLSHQHTGKVDIYQRLWWLLTCTPGAGGKDVPADWLVRGLRATGLAGPLRELYRQAVEDDPAEAFSERFSSLLASAAPAAAVAELFEWRIRSAARLDNWKLIADDVQRLGDRFRREDEKVWLRLMFVLADGLVWDGGKTAEALLTDCRAEIKRLEFLASEFSGWYDRFDLLTAVAPGYQELLRDDNVPAELLEIIRLSRARPLADLYPYLKALLDEVARGPQRWLAYFDRVHMKSPGALALLGQLLEQYESELEYPPPLTADPEMVAEVIQGFLTRSGGDHYVNCRPALLEMHLREALTPDQVAEVASNLAGAWGGPGSAFARMVTADWPLRYTTKAWHLFWA